jgi:hypothetical protein
MHMTAWEKGIVAGVVLGAAAYGLSALVFNRHEPDRYRRALVPGITSGIVSGVFSYVAARPRNSMEVVRGS